MLYKKPLDIATMVASYRILNPVQRTREEERGYALTLFVVVFVAADDDDDEVNLIKKQGTVRDTKVSIAYKNDMKVRIDWDGRVRYGWLVIIMNSQEVSYFTHTHTLMPT